jgi:hypothetical protein
MHSVVISFPTLCLLRSLSPALCEVALWRRRLVAAAWGCLLTLLASVPFCGASAEDTVGVLITGPLAATVGEKLNFEVELVNRSGAALAGLRIVDYFDAGFRHEASLSPIEQKTTVDLAAGTSRRLTLEFFAASQGRQCHRVEILDPSSQFVGGATACVEVSAPPQPTVANNPPTAAVPGPQPQATARENPAAQVPAGPVAPPSVMTPSPSTPENALPDLLSPQPSAAAAPVPQVAAPSLEMEITGPTERKPGGIAEFIATVHNTGGTASSGGTLELSWDRGFIAAEASDGYVMGTDKVSWELPDVEPAGKLRRRINLKLPSSVQASPGFREPRLCIRGVLSGVVGGVLVADECCVAIAADPAARPTVSEAGLRMSLADCDDPIQVGSSTTLICTIRNDGSGPSGLLNATIMLPEQARLIGDPTPSRVRIDGRTVIFDGLPSLAAGAVTALELAFRIPSPGRWRSEAVLTGDELDGSLTTVAETTALSP